MATFTCFLPLICLMSLFFEGTTFPLDKESKKKFESEEYTRDSMEESRVATDSSDSEELLKTHQIFVTTEKNINRNKRWMSSSTTSTRSIPGINYKPWLFAI